MTDHNKFAHKMVFDDVDVLGEAISNWDLEVNQLEGGFFHGSIAQVARDGWIVGGAVFSQPTDQKGLSPAGLRTVVITGSSTSNIIWRNHHIGGNDLMIFPVSGELDAIGYRDFRIFTLSFKPEDLNAQLRILGVTLPNNFLDQAEVLKIDPADILVLRRRLAMISSVPDHQKPDGGFLPNPLKVLALSITGALGAKLPNLVKRRDQALVTAIKILRADHCGHIPIHSLSRALGVGRRTLDAAFNETVGVAPGAYRKMMRLNRVHRMLHRADPNIDQVKEVAQSMGFQHLSQFATDYKRFFGVLPSHSLQTHVDSTQDANK